MTDLPLIRHSERVAFKRCQKKWYWSYRMGYVPKAKSFGALSFGTWMHTALEQRYTKREGTLLDAFDSASHWAIVEAHSAKAPGYEIEKAEELRDLGLAVAGAYDRHYGDDPDVRPIAAEIPLRFEITDDDGRLLAYHKLKPDLLFRDPTGDVWLMEHKTAAQIRLEHLPIDDQARPYVAMAEFALRKEGILTPADNFKGVMYNFLRKQRPDTRAQNAQGHYLNKNGTVSKKQPAPVFVRHPIVVPRRGKLTALRRLQTETRVITDLTHSLRSGEVHESNLMKTPHSSCPKLCDYFNMCTAEDNGGDWREMGRSLYVRRNPYTYDEETADIPTSFELS
jgi:hypothetical protein